MNETYTCQACGDTVKIIEQPTHWTEKHTTSSERDSREAKQVSRFGVRVQTLLRNYPGMTVIEAIRDLVDADHAAALREVGGVEIREGGVTIHAPGNRGIVTGSWTGGMNF